MKRVLIVFVLLVCTAVSVPAIQSVACDSCAGSGDCHACEGSGTAPIGGVCFICNGSEDCQTCNGSGEF